MPYKDPEVAKQKARERRLKNLSEIKARRRASYYKDHEKTKERNKENYLRRRDTILNQQKNRQQTLLGWQRRVFHSARARAKLQNLTFNLVLEDIPTLPDRCPILGFPLKLASKGMNAASLDRIDNSKGYEKGNIQIISDRANRLKRDATLEELVTLGKWAAFYLANKMGDNSQ